MELHAVAAERRTCDRITPDRAPAAYLVTSATRPAADTLGVLIIYA
jgi:hypothetical protein